MTRKNKVLLTSLASVSNQIVTIISGFIIPRLFLTHYGSEVNGLVSSIVQFLGFITLAECGVGTVVGSSLYKPLAEKNNVEISKIVISSERFFRKLSVLLFTYTAALFFLYPTFTKGSFDFFFTASLILVISISSFAQYFIGMTYRILLNSDQLGFISLFMQVAAIILNTGICAVLIHFDFPVHAVKLTSSVIFLFHPIILTRIAKKLYPIDRTVVLTEEPIKQKWNGVAQHVASVILNNTDVVVLTLFSTLKNVSIYAVYNLVANGMKNLIYSLTLGTQALFGNLLAKETHERVYRVFCTFEWIMHTITVLAFGVTAILIVPFVSVYTRGVTDVQYIQPVFALLITAAQGLFCIRLPYSVMVVAAGHYKQTQLGAFIESVINIAVSVALVINFGLVGVAIGTIAAITFRTFHFALYINKHILNKSSFGFFKHLFVDALTTACFLLSTAWITKAPSNYAELFVLALEVGVICLGSCAVINLVFYRKTVLDALSFLKSRKKAAV